MTNEFNQLFLRRYDDQTLYLTDSALYFLVNKGEVIDEIYLDFYDKIGFPAFVVVKIGERCFGIKYRWNRKANRFTYEQPYEVERVDNVIANWKTK